MIDAIIRWSLGHRLVVVCVATGMMIFGLMQAREMTVDVFPDLTSPTVAVLTEAHGMAPEEAERLITRPLESALNGSSGVRRIRSVTSVGLSVIWVEFDWGMDLYRARQVVSEKLQLVQGVLPEGIDAPVLAPATSIMGEITFIGLWSEELSPMELRTLAQWDIRRRLLGIPGVAQVTVMGGELEQVQVKVHAEDLIGHGVTLDDVVQAVRSSNEDASAGFYRDGGDEVLITGLGRVTTMEELGNSVVRPGIEEVTHGEEAIRQGGKGPEHGAERESEIPVRIKDVAEVEMGGAPKRGEAAINGRNGVVMGIMRQPDAATMAVTERIEEVLDEIETRLPEGVRLEKRLLRQADFIETSVDNVFNALRDGALLVVVIIGLFLFSARATFITAMAIPLSLLLTILVLEVMGASLNTMTLGGMAIAVGALVDDAIIDVENVARRLRLGRGPEGGTGILEIVFEASKEIRGSIVFATLIIVLVFLPLFFLDGVEGRLLEPLAVAYVVSLGSSLLVALTVSPVLCSLLLPSSRAVRCGEESRLVSFLKVHYEALLRVSLTWRKTLVVVSVLLVVGAIVGGIEAGKTFLPDFNEGSLTVSVVTFPGTALEESVRLGSEVERRLLEQPEVVSTARRTGRAELDEHAQGVNASEIEVRLEMKGRSKEELLYAIRKSVSTISGVQVMFGQPISHRIDHMLSGTRASIAIKVFGEEIRELQRVAKQIQEVVEEVPGAADVGIEEQSDVPVLTIRLKRDALALHHLQVKDVMETLEIAYYGKAVSQVRKGELAFDIVVRYNDTNRVDLEAIRETRIATPSGAWVPLETLAEIYREVTPNQIGRENGKRKLVVMSNVAGGYDLGGVVEQMRHRIAEGVKLPEGMYVTYGGQFEAREAASSRLGVLSALVVFGVFLLLVAALGNFREAGLVMVNLPLSLIGGVVGVWVMGGTMSIASIIGFITLFGIATRNGIMLVTHVKHLQEVEGVSNRLDAVVQGASERLSPILMTAFASGLGLLPLALANGEPGSEIQSPMAIVILFGLVSSTLMNMLVVPAMMVGKEDLF